MKNKIKYIAFLAILITIASSCQEDLLDKKPLDKISSADVWGSKGLIEGYMAEVYAQVIPLYTFNSNSDDDWSDDIHSDFNRSVTQEVIDDSYNAGWNQYGKIRICNQAITEIGNNEVLDEQEKKEFIAEARMLRAMTYYWMVRRFGGVMKVDRVLQPEDDMQLPRASESEMIDFMVEDLNYAKDNLPETTPVGKLNRAAAHAFLIRVLLHGLRYNEVINEANDFINVKNNYGYAIDPDFSGIHNNFGGVGSSDNIFVRYGDTDGFNMEMTPMQYRLPLANGENDKPETINDYEPSYYGWAMYYPTQDLADAFLMVDDDGMAKKWWETNIWEQHKDDGEMATAWMYKNRDKRFYSTLIYDGAIYSGDTINIRPPYWAHRSQMTRNLHRAMTGYLIRKGMYDDLPNFGWPPAPQDYHWPLIRVSEVYLNYAEAVIREGREGDALPYINATRTIHGELPEITSTENILEVYKNERRCELAFELHRYWDLIRWAKAENLNTVPELNVDPTYIEISGDGSTYAILTVNGAFVSGDQDFYNTIENKVYNNGSTFAPRVFTQKRFYFPVPRSEMQENPNLAPQNPGW